MTADRKDQAGEVADVSVLVVDDHPPFRNAIRAILAATPGFVLVGEVGDGCEAATAVEATQPDLVLMDVNLPVMNGIDATRAVVAVRPATVVLLCSTYALEELPETALTSGASGYVSKAELSPRLLAELWARFNS